MKQTSFAARECLFEPLEALGHGETKLLNELVHQLCEKHYITGDLAESIANVIWHAIYLEREKNGGYTLSSSQKA